MLNNPGWLFLDKDQVDAFNRMIADNEGEDTVDQLGFNGLTNEISDRLFPWCSTLTTRARYYIFSAAVIELAIERTIFGVSKSDASLLTRSQLRDLTRTFQREIMKLERILGLSLYSLYRGQAGTGVFGKRNLDRIDDRQLEGVLRKQLLSLPGRYPNAIYRNGLQVLSLFCRAGMTNTFAIQLTLATESPFNPEWTSAARKAKIQIERFEEYWTDTRLKSKSFTLLCEQFKNGQLGKQFLGFRLDDHESELLRKQILNVSPYLKPLSKGAGDVFKSKTLQLRHLAEQVSPEEKPTLIAAAQVDELISPFRTMYSEIGQLNDVSLKSFKFNAAQIKSAHRALSRNSQFEELAAVLETTEPWVNLLLKSGGKVTSHIIDHLKLRAEEIVSSRNKTAPHLIPPDKKKALKSITHELDITQSSFRLWNARRVLLDVFGDADAA